MARTYPPNFEEKIGFDRIRELIRDQCESSAGAEAVEGIRFLTDHEAILRELQLTEEFRLILLSERDFPSDPFQDYRPALQRIQPEGTFLSVEELAAFRGSLLTLKAVVRFFRKEERERYPMLSGIIAELKFYPALTDRIDLVLDKNNRVKDSASPELRKIRKAMNLKQSEVNSRMEKIMKGLRTEGLIDTDARIALRNGRPVLPVPAVNKRRISGIIHDESATGKTSFIEPQEVVEINNEIRELEYAEKREITKILLEVTGIIRPYTPELNGSAALFGTLDLLRAKARFALNIHARRPELLEGPVLDWQEAFHPLLFLAFQKENRKVIPLDMILNREQRILVISGPNAGGKSVCLQTVGLLQYMMQCGCLVSMDERSKMGIFNEIFMDMGDEQSIENDLSTYSSRLLNMKYFLKNAGKNSLVLIDEFGTGTEPMLGGAIAESILTELNRSGTFGVITTHYTNLKHFASSAEGIQNGAMLFDHSKLEPMFRLEMGKPGSSFAFEIARKIGLPEDLLKHAESLVGEEQVEFDRHLKDIARDKRYWENKRKRIRQAEKKLDQLLEQYSGELEKLDKQKKEILQKARNEADTLLSTVNKRIENTIQEIREAQAEKERTREARRKLEALSGKVRKEAESSGLVGSKMEKVRKQKRKQEKIKRARGEEIPGKQKEETRTSPPRLEKGSLVSIKGQPAEGEVLEIMNDNARVRLGSMVTIMPLKDLVPVGTAGSGSVSGSAARGSYGEWDPGKRKLKFRSEIDLRGKRVDEALQEVADFIDEAVVVNATELRILHGKGDGILRQVIRDYLQSVDVVSNYRDEHVQQGGAGVTLVKLDL